MRSETEYRRFRTGEPSVEDHLGAIHLCVSFAKPPIENDRRYLTVTVGRDTSSWRDGDLSKPQRGRTSDAVEHPRHLFMC